MNGMSWPLAGIALAILLQVCTFSFWLGKLSQKVQSLDCTIKKIMAGEIVNKDLEKCKNKISRIEGELFPRGVKEGK